MLFLNFLPHLIEYGTYSVLTIFLALSFGFSAIFFVHRFFFAMALAFHAISPVYDKRKFRVASSTIKMKFQLKIYTFFVCTFLGIFFCFILPFSFFWKILLSEWNTKVKEGNTHFNLLENCSVDDVIYIQPIHFHRFCCANGISMLIYIQSQRYEMTWISFARIERKRWKAEKYGALTVYSIE